MTPNSPREGSTKSQNRREAFDQGTLQFQTDWTAEQAFFQNKVNSLLCFFHEIDQPLDGLAGSLDWRLQGQISRLVLDKKISGKLGERVYLPVITPGGETYSRIFLVGLGKKENKLSSPSENIMKLIRDHFSKLGVGPIGISQSDFNETSEGFYKKWLGELPFWVFR